MMGGAAELAAVLAFSLWEASLSGTPRGQDIRKWMQDVRVGDLVVETTNWVREAAERWRCIGVLREAGEQPVLDEDGTAYATEKFWVVEAIDDPDTTTRWTNASFVRVPSDEHHLRSLSSYGRRCEGWKCPICARAVPVHGGRG